MSEWKSERPTEPGWYWCQQYQYRRVLHVWRGGTSALLFTNECGGAPLEEPMYDDARWWGPLDEPD